MRRTAEIVVLLTVLLLCSVGSTQLTAQLRIPNLNGHRFIADESISDPFTETFVLSEVGLGVASSYDIPLLEINGDTLTLRRGELVFATLGFGYQQQVKDWLGVHANLVAVGRLGTDAQTILSEGVTASSRFELGWLIRALKTERSQLSVDLGYRTQSTSLVDLFGFVGDIVDGKPAKLVKQIPSVHGVGDVRYAHAFNDLVGLKLFGSVLFGEQTQSRDDNNEFSWAFGAGLSFDPRPRWGIPIGVLLTYSVRTLSLGVEDRDSDTHRFVLKLEYTDTEDFSIGPTISLLKVPGSYNQTLNYVTFNLSSRYYF